MRGLIERLARWVLREEIATLQRALHFHQKQAGELTAKNTKLQLAVQKWRNAADLRENAVGRLLEGRTLVS